MSRVLRSLLTLKHLSLPFRSFVPPKFIVPLNRNLSFIFPTSLSVRCNHSNLVEPFPPLPQNPPVTKFPLRVYADYSVYTSKGVLTLAPKPPGFESKASGAFGVSREGYMLLQFAPSVGTEESIYDWNQKQIKTVGSVAQELRISRKTQSHWVYFRGFAWVVQDSYVFALQMYKCVVDIGLSDCLEVTRVFSLSVSEMGTVISLGEKDSWEFSRKSAKPNSNGIEVRKVLKVEPLVDATGHSFSLSVYKKPATMEEIEENIYLPVTRAHLAVLRSIFNYIIPYLLGWNAFASTVKPEVYSQVNSANPRYSANNERKR
ncbi:hypothetical protein ACSQ67_025502 [Phaseolus vulgaris]